MKIDFNKGNGLVPVIVQNSNTMQVLMLGYMNEEAFMKTNQEKRVTFFSRSKQRLWTKGETSGNYFLLQDLIIDCDNDTILCLVIPQGPACHTGSTSCFNTETDKGFIYELQHVINRRISETKDGSYTYELFKKGINKIAQKVGEEAIELVIEAKDENIELFKNEAADLLYHYLILLKAKNLHFEEVEAVLKSRAK